MMWSLKIALYRLNITAETLTVQAPLQSGEMQHCLRLVHHRHPQALCPSCWAPTHPNGIATVEVMTIMKSARPQKEGYCSSCMQHPQPDWKRGLNHKRRRGRRKDVTVKVYQCTVLQTHVLRNTAGTPCKNKGENWSEAFLWDRKRQQ